ncbi:MAG: methyltransferase domain-containing protein [Gemmatales bacterium]|nr:methyltransferase domain-containing protein [Gemmatales bacterium]
MRPRFWLTLSALLTLSVPVALWAQRTVLASTLITIHVPADAKIEIGGYMTKSTGEVRHFVTPPLQVGREYSYDLVITYADGTVRREVISFIGGKPATFDFRKAKPKPPDKAEPKKPTEDKKPPEKKPEDKKPPEKKPPVDKKPPEKKSEDKKPVEDKKPPELEPEDKKPVEKIPEDKKPAEKKPKEPPPDRKPDVIFVPTPQPVVEAMLQLAKVTKEDVVYDLGCGDGRIVVTAAKKYGARAKGIDLDPQRIKESLDNVRKNGVENLVTIERADLFEADLSEATVITLYLLPELNLKLRPKLQKLKPGTRIVSHDFDMGDWKPHRHITVTDENGLEHDVYLWIIGEPEKTDKDKSDSQLPLPGDAALVILQEKPKLKPDVVYVPTPQKVVEKMLEVAKVTANDVVYDLGCGDGRIVVTAARLYGCKAVGYDIDPERVKESLENVRKNGVQDLVTIEQRDIFTVDVSPATVVCLYLLPNLNAKLVPQLQKMKPGSRVVTHDFRIPGYKHVQEFEVDPGEGFARKHHVYLYIIPLQKEEK